jgi:GxxExxY protein
MSELLYKEEVYQIVGFCMAVHRELGKGYDEIVCRDALEIELKNAGMALEGEKKFEVAYKGVVLPHCYYADFVIQDTILLETKACESLHPTHVKQVLNYLAASKLKLAFSVNFGSDSLDWKRIVLSQPDDNAPANFRI